MNTPLRRIVSCMSFLTLLTSLLSASDGGRERQSFDSGWRFHLGNDWGIAQNLAKAGTGYGPAAVGFSDASWRRVDLPHDWAVELPFDRRADVSHGFKAIGRGFPQNSVAWYRRTFDLPAADSGRRIWLEFDGVFRDCTVFVNGWFVGHHESGYSGFRYDVTDLANCGGPNLVAVKVDATEPEGWFYEGAGIYRHVWLVKTGAVAIAPDGIFVFSRPVGSAASGPADVEVETRVANASAAAADVTVAWEVLAPDGRQVGSTRADVTVAASGDSRGQGTVRVAAPEHWSPESPRLYRLVTTVSRAGSVIDRTETEFGIRTFAFDPEKGFLLNGSPYVLKGTCNHQDHAGVGAAVPDAVQYFRIARLKEMGCNAYRTSHNPPTPELLQACDRLGMLVMDENRLLGSDAAEQARWEGQIRRDRNHASVAIWSVANEEFTVQGTPAGKRVAATLQAIAQRLDPTRPVTYAAPVGNEFAGINEIIEVRGWNYHVGPDMDAYHAAHPAQPNVGTEQGSTVGTRGIYANDPQRGYVSAYDDNAPSWATTAKTWMSYFGPRPWLSGGFVWTGFDYRGEPTPYDWPCINSHFGILDTCGFPKDNFWYYRSWWTTAPVLHLLPHWNWAGREGQPIDVRALSNCDEVELFLNGASQGRKPMPRMGELKWNVPYAPGTLSARGFKAGRLVAETTVETTGAAATVGLAPDRPALSADGRDVAVITVAVRDGQGRVVPTAGNHVTFSLRGPGRILGVGNGDPSCHEPDVYVTEPAVRTLPIDQWRLKRGTSTYAEEGAVTAAVFDDSAWETTDARAESGPLGARQSGVYRAHLTMPPAEPGQQAVELWFGAIEGQPTVYVNGQRLAGASEVHGPVVYDITHAVRPGDNTIAVTLGNWGSTGGLTKGAALRIVGAGAPAAWSRSVFNGLAQILVQASTAPGEIVLTASAEGLQPATLAIPTQASAAKATMP